MGTKKFDAEDIEAFLKLLPKEAGKLPLRHALEVRNDTFKDTRFYDLARKHNVAIVYAHDRGLPRDRRADRRLHLRPPDGQPRRR